MSKDHFIVLEGVDAADLPVDVLGTLCGILVEGSQRAARLVAEGRSTARGVVPAWAAAAADLRISKFERGSLRLEVRASRLVDVAPEIFAQQHLFPAGTDPDATSFDLLLDAADDAAAGRRDSERLDTGVLEILARTGFLVSRTGGRLTVSRTGKASVVIDSTAAMVIKELGDETPATRMSRVRGVLDSLTVSTKAIALRLDDGSVLRGFAGAVGVDKLKSMLGLDVVLEGPFTFRPSGKALRVEVESALIATPGDTLWAQLPKVEPAAIRATRARLSTIPTGFDTFFGSWPGDETDEQLADALQKLS